MVTTSSSLPIAANHARFSELVEQVLAYARQAGASDAVAEVSESLGLSVSVRKGTSRPSNRPATARWT
ncbi:protease [Bordetella trematum]|nr:protease [Bordetella trematum]